MLKYAKLKAYLHKYTDDRQPIWFIHSLGKRCVFRVVSNEMNLKRN